MSSRSRPGTPPVVLVHGVGSTHAHNWVAHGWADALADEGRHVVPFELPGHGAAPPLPPDGDEVDVFLDFLAERDGRDGRDGRVDVVGFSAGGRLALSAAARRPAAFRRAVALGVGDHLLRPSDGFGLRLADQLEGPVEAADPQGRLFRRMATWAGNDLAAVAGYLRRRVRPLTPAELAGVTVPVLLVLGDRDFAGPADALAAALPDARLVTLRGVDHFATTSDVRAMDAVTRFLAAGTE